MLGEPGPVSFGGDDRNAVVVEGQLLSLWFSTTELGLALRSLLHQAIQLQGHQSFGATLCLMGLMVLESEGPEAALGNEQRAVHRLEE